MIRKIEPSEHQIQCAIVEWANKTKMPYGENIRIGDFLLAIPNGGNRSITEAVRLKKEGVKKGVSDMFLAIPRAIPYDPFDFFTISGLWIEVKTNKGKISNEQKEWVNLMNKTGYLAIVVRTIDEGIKAIKDYLGMR